MSRINDPSLSWKDGDIPFSQSFDDIYYKADGLAETHTVFLEGNDLPQAWIGQPQFTICETGFGTGLNFLSAWKLFEETATGNERLDFISFEQNPLRIDDLKRSLMRLTDVFGVTRIDRFLNIYPPRIPGFHRRHVTDRVTLTLVFDDALRGLRQLEYGIDAWFLDGFNPAKNESLWQQDIFTEMARLSHAQTTLASYTAVTSIRRNLQEVGFAVDRIKGFGYKKHRIIGRFQTDRQKTIVIAPEVVHIFGAGLAGAGVAYALKRRDIKTEIFEKTEALGNGASGNQLGLINPKIEAQDNPRTDAGLAAFSFAQHILNDVPNVNYKQHGALHLAYDADKQERLRKLYDQSSWLTPHMRWVPAAETEELCGIASAHDGLFYSDSGSVNTNQFVRALLRDATIHFSTEFTEFSNVPTVLACGLGLNTVDALTHLPLQPVRGQVTYIDASAQLKLPVMFGSYIAPTSNGQWAIGATFEQNNDEPVTTDTARSKNIAAAQTLLDIDLSNAAVISDWAQIRTASRDRFPIVGKIADNAYVTGALGSHGIQFSLLLGEIIACMLTGAPMPIGKDALEKLSVSRFGR